MKNDTSKKESTVKKSAKEPMDKLLSMRHFSQKARDKKGDPRRDFYEKQTPGNPNPSPSTRFRKGQKPPAGAGRPKGSSASKEMKRMTADSIATSWNRIALKKIKELEDFCMDKNNTTLDVVVARAMLRDIKFGEMVNTNQILERIVGKVMIVQKTLLSDADGNPLSPPSIQFMGVISDEPSEQEESQKETSDIS